MLTDLPGDIRGLIYDKLPPKDRVMLNIALPKEQRVTATTTTNEETSKILGMVQYMIDRTKPEALSTSIMQCLTEHHQDEHAQQVLSMYCVPNQCVVTYSEIDTLVNEVQSNCLRHESLEVFDDMNNLKQSYLEQKLIVILPKLCTGESFEQMMKHPHAQTFLKRCWLNTRESNKLFFEMVNFQNVSLLQYIMANRQRGPDLNWDEKIAYIRDPNTASIFFSLSCSCVKARLLVEDIQLSYDVQQRCLRLSIDKLNVPVIEYLFSMGIRL